MFIEFTKEYLDKIILDVDNEDSEDEWVLLNNALNSMYNHHHIVYFERDDIKKLLSSDKVESNNKRVLKWSQAKINDLHEIKINAKYILQIGLSKTENKNEANIYFLSIDDISEFKESVLISENSSDVKFYKNIAQWFIDNSLFDISLENTSCGGCNCYQIILDKSEERKNICCVFDTDKSYEKDVDGGTLKQAIKAENDRNNKDFPFLLIPLKVREKENLFPFTLYSDNTTDVKIKKIINILNKLNEEELYKFYDVKSGIKLKKIKDEKVKNSDWIKFYDKFIIECTNEGLVENCPPDCCEKCSDCGKKMIYGIGGLMHEDVSSIFFKDYKKKNDVLSKIDEIFLNQKYIIDMWEEINLNLFAFGCCISTSIKYNV